MTDEHRCSKCGSEKIVPRARVLDRDHGAVGGNVRVGVARRPHKLFTLQKKADVYARVCGECGFAELFVDDAATIYDAYLQAQSRGES